MGDNSAGELGNATLTAGTSPVSVTGLQNAQALASGGRHNLALLTNGTVMAWGDNTFGQLGNGAKGTNHDAETALVVQRQSAEPGRSRTSCTGQDRRGRSSGSRARALKVAS